MVYSTLVFSNSLSTGKENRSEREPDSWLWRQEKKYWKWKMFNGTFRGWVIIWHYKMKSTSAPCVLIYKMFVKTYVTNRRGVECYIHVVECNPWPYACSL